MDALWQLSKGCLPAELAYYLDVECDMLVKRYVSDPKGYGKFLRALHSSNRLAASGTSSIGIERMFHTEEHRAKMDVFLEKVAKRCPPLPNSAELGRVDEDGLPGSQTSI